jgi:hypothetical protein
MGKADLCGWPFAQRAGFGRRHFGARDFLESVDRMTCYPEGDSALRHGKTREHRESVKRAALGRSRDVKRQSPFCGNEEVVDHEIVTAGAAGVQ